MAKCNRCGRGGLFHKMGISGNCLDCETIISLENERDQITAIIEKRKESLGILDSSIVELQRNRDQLFEEISNRAKRSALASISDQITQGQIRITESWNKISELDGTIEKQRQDLAQSEKIIILNANKLKKIQTLFKGMQYSSKRYFDELEPSRDVLTESQIEEAEEILSTTVKLKFHLMDIRELRRQYNQNQKLVRELLARYQGRYTTKYNIAIYRLMVMALEAELQNVLFNLSYSKLDKAIENIKIMTTKYEKIAIEGNQNIAPTVAKFIGEIQYLYIEAIKIEYEYYIQKERIKEEQRAIRDQMRQEAAERKLLETERKKVEQEESKYENEIMNIKEQILNTQDDIKIRQLEERMLKVQVQLDEVEKKKEDIINLQNGIAGYIYVISNLGSFGDSVFKIGMTRRLNPQDRIDELGDASVPFRFDVHSLIFSNSAPELENQLHKHLNSKRVNKINLRKEFFRTSLDELEELVYSLEPSAEFNRTMLAEQYHQSMAVDEVPESIALIEDDEEQEEEI